MCYFITATLPSKASVETVRLLAKTYGLNWRPIENLTVSEQLEDGELQYLTTRGHCDCGTELGSANRTSEKAAKDISYSNEIMEFRKKGWSESKIQRWLAEKEKVNKREARIEAEQVKLETEIDRWIAFIEKIIENKTAVSIGVLLHNYSGDIETERIQIKSRESQSISNLKREYLLKIEEDIIYEYHS